MPRANVNCAHLDSKIVRQCSYFGDPRALRLRALRDFSLPPGLCGRRFQPALDGLTPLIASCDSCLCAAHMYRHAACLL